MPITFHTADIKFTLKQKRKLKAFIQSQILTFSNSHILKLSIVFTSDEYLRAINKQFLNHDYYTDILTFPLSESKQSIEAEIYISIERVRENAEKFNPRTAVLSPSGGGKGEDVFTQELHRVIFHGILHLLGYNDKTKTQQAAMRKMEEEWLKKFSKF